MLCRSRGASQLPWDGVADLGACPPDSQNMQRQEEIQKELEAVGDDMDRMSVVRCRCQR